MKRNYQPGAAPRRREPGRRRRRAPRLLPVGDRLPVVPTGQHVDQAAGSCSASIPTIGDFSRRRRADRGQIEIVAVGPGLSNGEAEVIDASGMIVMPGFVDSHRHIWEGLLRNIGTDVPLEGRSSYISLVLHKLAPAFRPEDAYMGNLDLGARRDRRRDHHAARLVAHPGLTRPHRRGDPGARRTPACGPCSPTGSRGGASGRSASRAGSSGPPPSTSPPRTRCSPWPWRRPAPSSPTSR